MSASMYYIAIAAPREINEQVLKWKHYMLDNFGCAVALKSPAHITLISPFWMNEIHQHFLETSLEQFSNKQKSFTVELKDFDCFKPRVLFVGVINSPELHQLKTAIEEYLLLFELFPIKKESRPFHPHITIANRDLRKKDFYVAWEHFGKKKYEANFLAREVSLLKHNGAKWEIAFSAAFKD